jgi:FMN-dependent NADH-azoreductase
MSMRSAARAKAPVSATRTKASTSTRSTEERSIKCNTKMRAKRLLATHVTAYIAFSKFMEAAMTKVLIIDSAATGDASVSRKLTAEVAERLSAREPAVQIVRRDIGASPIPHLTAETVRAIRGVAETAAEQEAGALADALTKEIQEADLIVIGAPMYNFGMSSTLKAWFDHVLRAGVTFRYTEAGPEGLVRGKRAVVIETRAGLYSEGPAAVMDNQEPHIRTLLGFMGVTDVTFIRAEKLAFGPDAAAAAIADAVAEIGGLADNGWALAA